MSKISNMELLRDSALQALEDLAAGKIDTNQAKTTAQLCESVINTVKSQYEYARLIDEEPSIPFMQECHYPMALEKKKVALEGKTERRSLPSPSYHPSQAAIKQ